ncbi:MAG TPA: diguanylate cyclase [Vicinamibacteria bacterium]|nr:diguanylate cyclase [Vicinamibacteria bacterium]
MADDSAAIRRMVSLCLRHAGYRVTEAGDGAEAWSRFRAEPSAVVITDVNMPGIGGLDLLARLRDHNPAPEVILLTGTHAEDAQVAVEALRLGAHDYIKKDPQSLEAVVLAAARALEKFRLRQENALLVDKLRRQSLTDSLTGVANRRAFDETLAREVARARRSHCSVALAMVDLDLFKRINDAFGHRVGDEVLSGFAARLKSVVRLSDTLFRFGGEEFVVLLPDQDRAAAAAAAARFVQTTAVSPFEVGPHRIAVTCSAGVAELSPRDDPSGGSLVARADAALYAAKRAGRNRVVADGETLDTAVVAGLAC